MFAAVDGDFIVISADANTSGKVREAFVSVSLNDGNENSRNKLIKVTQAASDISFELFVKDVRLSRSGEGIKIPYSSDAVLTAESGADWCSATIESGFITISAQENLTGREREAFVKITAEKDGNKLTKVLNVVQGTEDIVLEISVSELVLNAAGDARNLPFVSDREVSAKASENWLSVSVADGNITVSAEPNTGGQTRECILTVTAKGEGKSVTKSVRILQAKSEISLEIPFNEITLDMMGEEIKVPFTSSENIKVESGANWCKAVVDGNFIAISAERNRTGEIRKAYVTVTTDSGTANDITRVIEVSQDIVEYEDTLVLPVSELLLNKNGDEQKVMFAASGGVKVSSSSSWCKASVNGNLILISADENTTGDVRIASVTVTMGGALGKSIKVIQSTSEVSLELPINQIILNIAGDKQNVPYFATEEISIESSADWCIAEKAGQYIGVSSSRNSTGSVRRAFITVKTTTGTANDVSKVIDVIQASGEITLTIEEKELAMNAAGETRNIPYSCEFPIEVSSTESWLSASVGPDNLISLTAAGNDSGTARIGYVVAKTLSGTDNEVSKTIKVTQESMDIVFELSPSEINSSYTSTTTSVSLTSTGAWTINADAIPNWMTINPLSGSGSAVLNITLKTNKFIAERSASIAFTNTDYGLFTSLFISQQGNPTGIQDLGYLGRGYDASGEYAVDSYIRHNVLSQDSLMVYDHVADVLTVNASKEETINR